MKAMAHKTAAEFLASAGDWLEAEEAKNGLMLGLAGNIAAGRQVMDAPPALITASADAGPQAALLMTIPPRWAILYSPVGSEALGALVEAMLPARHQPRGCVGPSATAEAFARAWIGRTGQRATLKMAQRIYELRAVHAPTGVPGRLRPATLTDLDVAARWRHGFEVEASHDDNVAAARSAAERSIAQGQLFFWECESQPVSQAVATRPTPHGICIGAVYTPPERRGRGYASACVAALSQLQLDAGRRFCMLYTDLANPTSNSIYRKIGYVPVADSSHYVFDEGA